MANPLPEEHLIYEKIKRENITIPAIIWELIDHHINNDLYAINIILGSTVLDSQVLSEENAEKIMAHSKAIKDFLTKLEGITKPKQKDV